MGAPPSKGTTADKRLAANRGAGSRSSGSGSSRPRPRASSGGPVPAAAASAPPGGQGVTLDDIAKLMDG